jgi:hypothetical protein
VEAGKILRHHWMIVVIAAYLLYGVTSRALFDDRWILLVASAFFFWATLRGISTGTTFGKFGIDVTRSEEPVWFYFYVAAHGVLSIACLLVVAGLIQW